MEDEITLPRFKLKQLLTDSCPENLEIIGSAISSDDHDQLSHTMEYFISLTMISKS